MKSRLILVRGAVLFFCMSAIFAGKLVAQTPAEKLQSISQVLNLSPQQKDQLLPILKAEAPKLEAIKSNPSLSKRDKRKELKSIHDQADPQVKAILSPTQYGQWKDIRKQEIDQAKGKE